MIVKIHDAAGKFAENKDEARRLRIAYLLPALKQGKEIIIDFSDVDSATQSFIHALIRDPIQKYGIEALDKIIFKSCNESIKELIQTVSEYVQAHL